MSRVLRHADYSIAWIAVLPIEVKAALAALDRRHLGRFPSRRTDDYTFIGGDINGHNVVIAKMPAGQNYGEGAAAALINQVKMRFENIWFCLLVGVAAGLPDLSPDPPIDIRLGDVLVCVPDKASTGIVHYDLGRDTGSDFQTNGRHTEPPSIVRAAIGDIQLMRQPFGDGNALAYLYQNINLFQGGGQFSHPGQHKDQYFEQCRQDGGSRSSDTLVWRERRDESERTRVWYGRIGSGSSLMRNARRRDELRDRHNLIGLEMEAAGLMNSLPTAVVRGVCDYGDGHKTKVWQPYAAAVAAAYAKAILLEIVPAPSGPKLPGHLQQRGDEHRISLRGKQQHRRTLYPQYAPTKAKPTSSGSKEDSVKDNPRPPAPASRLDTRLSDISRTKKHWLLQDNIRRAMAISGATLCDAIEARKTRRSVFLLLVRFEDTLFEKPDKRKVLDAQFRDSRVKGFMTRYAKADSIGDHDWATMANRIGWRMYEVCKLAQFNHNDPASLQFGGFDRSLLGRVKN